MALIIFFPLFASVKIVAHLSLGVRKLVLVFELFLETRLFLLRRILYIYDTLLGMLQLILQLDDLGLERLDLVTDRKLGVVVYHG